MHYLAIAYCTVLVGTAYAALQSVKARGELGCPYRDEVTMKVKVEIWDYDLCKSIRSTFSFTAIP